MGLEEIRASLIVVVGVVLVVLVYWKKKYIALRFEGFFRESLSPLFGADFGPEQAFRSFVEAFIKIALVAFAFAVIAAVVQSALGVLFKGYPNFDIKLDGQSFANYAGLILGTAVALAGSLVAIVLALRSQKTSENVETLQKQSDIREDEQMRFNVSLEMSRQLEPIVQSSLRFSVGLEMGLRASAELSNTLERQIGLAVRRYLVSLPDELIATNGKAYKEADHADLVGQFLERGEIDERMQAVKKAIGDMATALEGILLSPVAHQAYKKQMSKSNSSMAMKLLEADPADLAWVVSILRNKSESRMSAHRIVNAWFLAMRFHTHTARFNEDFVSRLKNARMFDPEMLRGHMEDNAPIRHALLLGAIVGTWEAKSEVKNGGVALLIECFNALPTKVSIKEVFSEQYNKEKDKKTREMYLEVVDSQPYDHRALDTEINNGRVLALQAVYSLERLDQYLSSESKTWEMFRALCWQWAGLLFSNDFVFRAQQLQHKIKLCTEVLDMQQAARLTADLLRVYEQMLEIPSLRVKEDYFFPSALDIANDICNKPIYEVGRSDALNLVGAATSYFEAASLYQTLNETSLSCLGNLMRAEEKFQLLPEVFVKNSWFKANSPPQVTPVND